MMWSPIDHKGGDGKGLWRKELAKRVERCLEISPAAKDVEDLFAFLLHSRRCRCGKCLCLAGHCFLASGLGVARKMVFRVYFDARPFSGMAHVSEEDSQGMGWRVENADACFASIILSEKPTSRPSDDNGVYRYLSVNLANDRGTITTKAPLDKYPAIGSK
jgi:hypothetical protein